MVMSQATNCDFDPNLKGDLDPEYRRLNRERSAAAAAKTRTMQVIADPRSAGPVRAAAVGQRISFSNRARLALLNMLSGHLACQPVSCTPC